VTSREEPVDETGQQKLLPIRLNRRGPSLATVRLSPDGPLAIAVGGTTLSPAGILIQSDDRTFKAIDTRSFLAPAPLNDGPLLWLDADGDGREDLLVTRGGNALPPGAPEYEPRLYLNQGDGRFQAAAPGVLPEVFINAGAVAAADVDHDGRLDVFIGGRVSNGQYPIPAQSALLLNRGGKFEDVTDTLSPALREVGMVTSALWSDVDNDGWPDLLLALEWSSIRYFHNDQGHGFTDQSEAAGFSSAGSGWWTSLAAADFNGDGRIDYAAGNVGLNTQYRADPQHPALLFAGNFKGDGSSQLIEAYYEGDKLYPWRSRRDLGAVLPAIMKKFPRNDFYARATLGEILGEDKIAKAQRFAATELRSGVFLSQPDGTYRFTPLPRLAQIAPLQGMVAGDFDGDGNADLYAVQNSYAPIAAVGRFDGGMSQLLRGDGHGHFTPVPPAESRLIVPGDAKALVVLDFNDDGWPDFLASQNNASTLAFQNRGIPGRRSCRVSLHGPVGNPTAIGARVTVTLKDGSTQTLETYAGSGLYSQSTSDLFIGYSESNPPTSLSVRWPNGSSSQHAFPASQPPAFEITAP
jgi:hypothetical protein